MKKYLFGLGAMLVGAGLMFVLMHGEVSAENKEIKCELLEPNILGTTPSFFIYCKIKDLTCVSAAGGRLSCVKSFIS